ncbi:MAG: hypothetical protein HY204_00170 [Nitrospirae bacterium]|nr:hypothetical protein [Nitrospirota bacterium]
MRYPKIRTVIGVALLMLAGCAGNTDNNTNTGTPAQRAMMFAINTAVGVAQQQSSATKPQSEAKNSFVVTDISSVCNGGGAAKKDVVGTTTTFTFSTCKISSSGVGSATISGTATLTTVTGGDTIEIVSGTSIAIASAPFNGSLTIETQLDDLFLPTGASCPAKGTVISSGDFIGTAAFGLGGSVDIDQGPDGTVDVHYNSCLDATL